MVLRLDADQLKSNSALVLQVFWAENELLNDDGGG